MDDRLDFQNSEHNKIRTSAPVQAELRRLASRFAAEAGGRAGDMGGYGTDLTVGTDRARAHVWPQSNKAIGAEIKNAHLLTIVGNGGVK